MPVETILPAVSPQLDHHQFGHEAIIGAHHPLDTQLPQWQTTHCKNWLNNIFSHHDRQRCTPRVSLWWILLFILTGSTVYLRQNGVITMREPLRIVIFFANCMLQHWRMSGRAMIIKSWWHLPRVLLAGKKKNILLSKKTGSRSSYPLIVTFNVGTHLVPLFYLHQS